MHKPTLRILKRFQKPNFALNHQMNSKTSDVGLPTMHKPHIDTSDIEKVFDNNVIYSERNILSWLHKVAPCFHVNGSKITIIHEPNDFYTTILEKCKVAKKRITLASLYLGTGSLEYKLVKGIEEALHSNNGNIEVKILLDYMRGSRGNNNSRKMLEPLLKVYGDSCQVFLYHTPKLRGILKIVTPDRLNELIGLQHMKLYMVDDTLIISGANLSNDYFTNRQDRYFMIEDCRELCDFYNELVEKVGEFSFLLQSDGSTILNSSTNPHPYKDSKKEFAKEARNSIESLLQDKIYKCVRNRVRQINVTEQSSDTDTWIFPLVQMGQLNIQHDSEVTLKLLQTAPAGATIRLATGYFNLTTEYINAILKYCRATCHILTAHPTTNGFFSMSKIE